MTKRRSRRASALTAMIAGISLIGGTLAGAPASGQVVPACPEAMPTDDLESGMMGTGYTVSRGTEPEPFSAEILGVYPDAILPGRDLVIAEVHSPAIDHVGGVWFGMSGSPVFVDDGGEQKLVGAVAWGFSLGPSHIIGLTAGEDMVELIDYPNGAPTRAMSRRTSPSTVRLTGEMRRTIAQAMDQAPSEVEESFTQLKMPVSVSGVGTRTIKKLQRRLTQRHGMNVRLYAGSSVSKGVTADPTELEPGSNFAAVLSYGDLTLAGIGTTTFVCEGFAVAFGHPFSFQGATQVGANAASAITIYEDPVFSPFKLANVGGSVGAVDQDRFAGIRADFGEAIETIPITSRTFAETTFRAQLGRTDAVTSEVTTFVAPFHELSSIDSTFDEFGEGSAETRWTITGTKADGSTWELSRTDMASSQYDIAFEAILDNLVMISELYYQDFEEIEFTSVDWEQVTVRDEVRQYRIKNVLVSKDGERFRRTRSIAVRPGATVYLRVILDPYDDSSTKTVELNVTVPRSVRRGADISVFGGPESYFGSFGRSDSFDDLLETLDEYPARNSLNVKLRAGRKVRDEASTLLDQVVEGQRSIFVRIQGARGGGHGGAAEG